MHLLKKLKVTLKEASTESAGLESEIAETLQDIRIASIRKQVSPRENKISTVKQTVPHIVIFLFVLFCLISVLTKT